MTSSIISALKCSPYNAPCIPKPTFSQKKQYRVRNIGSYWGLYPEVSSNHPW